MEPHRLRARLLLAAAPWMGCSSTPSTPPVGSDGVSAPTSTAAPTVNVATSPTSSQGTAVAAPPRLARPAGKTSPGPRAWLDQQGVCIVAARTESRTAPAPGPPFEDCGGWPEFSVVSEEIRSLPCGPCGFTFNPTTTEQARAQRADACCYTTRSPPLGRPLAVSRKLRRAPLRRGAGWG